MEAPAEVREGGESDGEGEGEGLEGGVHGRRGSWPPCNATGPAGAIKARRTSRLILAIKSLGLHLGIVGLVWGTGRFCGCGCDCDCDCGCGCGEAGWGTSWESEGRVGFLVVRRMTMAPARKLSELARVVVVGVVCMAELIVEGDLERTPDLERPRWPHQPFQMDDRQPASLPRPRWLGSLRDLRLRTR